MKLLDGLGAGAAYVPFIGDGDLAVECYSAREIYGVDIDSARVETARRRLPGARIREADVDDLTHFPVDLRFALCDSDAYSQPYTAIEGWLRRARLCDDIAVFGTSGEMSIRLAVGDPIREPDGRMRKVPRGWGPVYRARYWKAVLLPYMDFLLEGRGFTRTREKKMWVANMLYWGLRAERNV